MNNDIREASAALASFKGESFKKRVQSLERNFSGKDLKSVSDLLISEKLTLNLFSSALFIKHNSNQINEIVHALGILIILPHILCNGERIESLSLAASNTGKGFDLETSERIAEFTFIEWQGGPEVIRQNKIFKDFYFLAESPSEKKKELFLVGTSHAESFFKSKRKLDQILKGNAKLGNSFRKKYEDRFPTVRDYFETKENQVILRDVTEFIKIF